MGKPNTYTITGLDKDKNILLMDITDNIGNITSVTMYFDQSTTQDKINAYALAIYKQLVIINQKQADVQKSIGLDQPIIDDSGKPVVLDPIPIVSVSADPINPISTVQLELING